MPPFKRKAAYILFIIICLVVSVAAGLHYRYPKPQIFPGASSAPIMIAHAGGMIGEHPYTNSLEAVQASIRDGF